MHKQEIKYTDYNDQDRTITEYFNLNKAEILQLQADWSINGGGGIEGRIDDVMKSQSMSELLQFLKDIVHLSYGKKSDDGIHFHKDDVTLKNFIDSAYYDDFLFDLLDPDNNGVKGQTFIKEIFPKKLIDEATEELNKSKAPVTVPTAAPSAREVFAQRTTDVTPQPPEHFQPETATQAPQISVTPTPQGGVMDDAQLQKFLEWQKAQEQQS